MQFRDLQKQYITLKPDIDRAVSQVLTNANFISGPQVSELETALAAYTGTKHCITCANGTDALTQALMVWDIGPGDAAIQSYHNRGPVRPAGQLSGDSKEC